MSREAHELSELTNFPSKDTLAELSEKANWDCLYFPQWRSWGYRAVCRWNWGLPCGEAPRGPGSLISAESEALCGAGRRVVFGRLPLQTRGGPGPALVSEAPLCQASLAHVLYTPRAPPRKTWVRPAAVSLPGPSLWPHLRQDGAHWTVLGDQFSPEVWACSPRTDLL